MTTLNTSISRMLNERDDIKLPVELWYYRMSWLDRLLVKIRYGWGSQYAHVLMYVPEYDLVLNPSHKKSLCGAMRPQDYPFDGPEKIACGYRYTQEIKDLFYVCETPIRLMSLWSTNCFSILQKRGEHDAKINI